MCTKLVFNCIAALRKFSSCVEAPSRNLLHVVDSLEWETSIARHHASTFNSLVFAFAFNLLYVPSELNSLESYEELYLNLTRVPLLNEDLAYTTLGAFAGGIGDEWRDPNMVYNAVRFYYGRIITRLILLLFMSGCIGAFIDCRLCIPGAIFHCYFQDFVFKELRGLHRRNTHFGTLLMTRLINADTLSSFAENHPNLLLSTDDVLCTGLKFKTSQLMSFVVNCFNPLFFVFVFIPNRILRLFSRDHHVPPQPFLSLRHACFQVILYNDSIRRSANVPMFFKECFCIMSSRFIPRRIFLKFCEPETRELLAEVDAVFSKFPIEQRIHLYNAIICHSNACTIILCVLFLLMFFQNALISELIVASWFAIPPSQIRTHVNDTAYALFHNYRELTSWEYIINDHFIFLLFFTVNLTCNNTTMFLVLAPTLVVTAAGFASNHGKSVDFSSFDPWLIAMVFVAYLLTFLTNNLTYRDVRGMFVNRAKDCAAVSDNTMLELSHEFMSLSHITLEAMDDCCALAIGLEVQHIRSMMWLLRKQRLQIQSFRPSDSVDHGSRIDETRCEVPILTLFKEEFEALNPLSALVYGSFGVYFASVCELLQCEIKIKYEFGDNIDVAVFCVESELRHFLCSFMLHVLLNVSDREPSGTNLLQIEVIISICGSVDLNTIIRRRPDDGIGSQQNASKHAHFIHKVCPLPFIETHKHYIQAVAEFTHTTAPRAHASGNHAQWLASFYDSDTVVVLEFATRMNGSFQIPRRCETNFDRILGAFALPCSFSAVSRGQEPAKALFLRLLILEDNPKFAEHLIAKIKAYPLASNYVVDHESNVADALARFSNAEHEADGRVFNGNARRSYDIVFVDRVMPMERGAREDFEAGIKAAKMLRQIEHEKGFTKCLLVGITSGAEREQEDFMHDCGVSDVWRCFGREKAWDASWDASVRAKLETYLPSNTA